MTAEFRLRYFFDWNCYPLWSANDAARNVFGYHVELKDLPISDQTVARIREICAWHDTALNWEYPPDPGPWGAEECERFNAAARGLLVDLRQELGPVYEIVDEFRPEVPGRKS